MVEIRELIRWWTTFGNDVANAAIVFSAVAAFIIITRTRRQNLLKNTEMRLEKQIEDTRFLNAQRELVDNFDRLSSTRLDELDQELYSAMISICDFFELDGYNARNRLLHLKSYLFVSSFLVADYWESFEHHIKAMRKEDDRKAIYINFEWLAVRAIKFNKSLVRKLSS